MAAKVSIKKETDSDAREPVPSVDKQCYRLATGLRARKLLNNERSSLIGSRSIDAIPDHANQENGKFGGEEAV